MGDINIGIYQIFIIFVTRKIEYTFVNINLGFN